VQRPDGTSTGEFREAKPPAPMDQPTVISNRPPLESSPPVAPALQGSLADLVPGSRLAHFEVREYVGGGGMGKVFRGIDTGLGRPVALKVLTREQTADPETLLRFRNEARNAARLNHDNIVQVYYVGEDRGLPFIAFEYVEGLNLRSLVEQKGPLPLAEALSYTLQVAEALAHAAQRNVVHRDIKPSNVLITPDSHAKLIDMGLARLQKMDDAAVDLTASGVTLGTFDYISPEQARDPRNADVRSDIYSLGCTLFYMLSGRPPFPEGTVLQKLLQHQGDEPPDVRTLRPDLPEEVSRVLRRMMAKEPGRRYQDPAKLIAALLTLAELVGLKPVGSGQAIWITPRPSPATFLEKHLPWLAPIAALVAIVLVLHLLWSGGGTSGSAPLALSSALDEPGQISRVARPAAGPATSATAASAVKKPQKAAASSPEVKAAAGPSRIADPHHIASATDSRTSASATDAHSLASATDPRPLASTTDPRPSASDVVPHPLAPPASPGDAHSALSPGLMGNGLPPDEGPLTAGEPASAAVGATAGSPSSAAGGGVSQPLDKPVVAQLVVTGAAESDDGETPASGPRRFRTLASACAAAHTGETIEICFNGRLEEKPLQVASSGVTVRAGEGFHPRIVFQPEESDPAKCPRYMIGLFGGDLTLQNLSLELEVPRQVTAENWSLIQLSPGQSLKLQRCWLTIRNASNQQTAYHPDVAFVRVLGSAGMDPAMGEEVPPDAASLVLTDCVARGEATFLKAEAPQPIDLVWTNGLVATTERFFSAEGGEQSSRPGQGVHLQLDHVTADLRGGLCRLARSEYAPHQLPCHLRCVRSMFFGSGKSPLVEQISFASGEDSLAAISWDGRQNSYPGFLTFWRIQQLDDSPSKEMTFDAWKTYWRPEHESQPGVGPIGWSPSVDISGPLNQHGPTDYAAASDKTADRPIAGMTVSRLPPPPKESETADELSPPGS
jgi:serine/threonine-protein kinase